MPPPSKKPGLPEVFFFHTASIGQYGGSEGVRDEGALLAAIERPWQASVGQEHFASPFEKAAALMESIIRRHPFVDGNKRTGTASAAYLLSTFGYEVQAEQEELEDFAVGVAVGDLETEDIALWFEEHTQKTTT
ncbi:MAG TPA: type II toxin-antitoxin system death-on-curing family toxin [Rubrobacteraceae bacterium]|jgi:death-on-curing protein|nr:type II toxin-antitoxin system death-on-curing family toxin [Rubrobacteraceae bacterium]